MLEAKSEIEEYFDWCLNRHLCDLPEGFGKKRPIGQMYRKILAGVSRDLYHEVCITKSVLRRMYHEGYITKVVS